MSDLEIERELRKKNIMQPDPKIDITEQQLKKEKKLDKKISVYEDPKYKDKILEWDNELDYKQENKKGMA